MRPVHILIVSKEHIKDLMDLKNKKIWDQILEVSKKIVKKEKLTNRGYRMSINGGGAQILDHLHVHISGPIEKNLSI